MLGRRNGRLALRVIRHEANAMEIRRMPRTGRRPIRWIIPLFLAPALLFYTLFFVYPALDAFRISLYDWSGFGIDAKFIGLKNFVEAFGDKYVRLSLSNNLLIMLAGG